MLERLKYRARLIRPLLVPFVIYIGLLVFAINWLEANPESSWRYLIAILPLLSGVFIAIGMVRAIGQLDELERKTLMDGMAISFACTFILALSLGLLGLAGFPQLNGMYIALFMSVVWLVGKLWMTWRYQ
jgi:hypothetical protein